MNIEYRIEPVGRKYVVVDPWGEHLIDSFPSEEAAKQAIAECVKEDDLWETATLLVDIATKTLMKQHNVDSDTARRLIRDAMGGA